MVDDHSHSEKHGEHVFIFHLFHYKFLYYQARSKQKSYCMSNRAEKKLPLTS